MILAHVRSGTSMARCYSQLYCEFTDNAVHYQDRWRNMQFQPCGDIPQIGESLFGLVIIVALNRSVYND